MTKGGRVFETVITYTARHFQAKALIFTGTRPKRHISTGNHYFKSLYQNDYVMKGFDALTDKLCPLVKILA